MKQPIEATASEQAINMPNQILYIIEQIHVCRCYNGSREEQKCNEKCGVSLA